MLTLCVALGLYAAYPGSADSFPPRKDLVEGVPEDFPRFFFAGHEEEASWLSRYLWRHFSTRLGYSNVVFNQEYLTTADLWMGGATHPGWPKPIQQISRDVLLAVQIDPEGYVHTHQHFSHAHEHGWPFPVWTQTLTGPEGFTAGWHFQHDGPGWVWDALRQYPDSPFCRDKSLEGWQLEDLRSLGIVDGKWQIEATGPAPALISPAGPRIAASCAPFLQLRWTRSDDPKGDRLPCVEWMTEKDSSFSPKRRAYFRWNSGNPDYEAVSKTKHLMAEMYRHPEWKGIIKQMRLVFGESEPGACFAIDSFFTVYDTRHTSNNPIYVLACWSHFRWTGDISFLQRVINPMRMALRYQQTEFGGLTHCLIRNPWVGHDGLPGFSRNPDGTKTVHYGQGIGSNYWDILPFGGDDMYATAQYYAATLAVADAEQAIRDHPEWGVPLGASAFDPEALRRHAAQVKRKANRVFWNAKTGRFVACIDREGIRHDYGFTFLNLDAIWYGIASRNHAQTILDWLTGKRIVEGDTSTGADIYRWRFGPRATTKRNEQWYPFVWTNPEGIPWGGQVQDGGAVLGFTFYDLWARLQVLGPDNAWQRLGEILAWEQEVWAEGGYRQYYADGKRGTTLQGGGTAGGLGIDFEFFESSLLPSIVTLGFLGLNPTATELAIRPQLPNACPEMGASNVLYRGARLDIRARADSVSIELKDTPAEPLKIGFEPGWARADTDDPGPTFPLAKPGVYHFQRQ